MASPSHHGQSLAASLPAELLARIFSVAGVLVKVKPWEDPIDHNTVLSFEERARAEVVCRHWRAALSSHRAAYPYVTLGLAGRLTGGPEQAAQAAAADDTATHRALAVAARPPAVECIELQVGNTESAGLVAANTQALTTLLSETEPKMVVVGCQEEQGLWPYLAEAARHSSLEELEVVCSERSQGGIRLVPRAGLTSLPHLRHLAIASHGDCPIHLTLPMPLLVTMAVEANLRGAVNPPPLLICPAGPGPRQDFEEWLETGPAAPAPPLFPSLRVLTVASVGCMLDGNAVPAVEKPGLTLYSPSDSQNGPFLGANQRAMSQLTSLRLAAKSRRPTGPSTEAGQAAELGEEEEEAWEESELPVNRAARLLVWLGPALRRLDMSILEDPTEEMAAALAGLVQLTSLDLGLPGSPGTAQEAGGAGGAEGAQGPGPGGGPQPAVGAPAVRFHCRLLAAMTSLQVLALGPWDCDCTQTLQHVTALQGLTSLHTLQLRHTAALLPLAPHLPPSCTSLLLFHTSPEEIKEEHMAALSGLRSLRHLTLLLGKDSQAQPAQVLRALVERLPTGCVVEVEVLEDWLARLLG